MSMQRSYHLGIIGIFIGCILSIIIEFLLGAFSLELVLFTFITGVLFALVYDSGFSAGKRESLHNLDETYLTGYQTGYNIGRSDQMLEDSYYTFDKEHTDSSINKDTIVITDAKIE